MRGLACCALCDARIGAQFRNERGYGYYACGRKMATYRKIRGSCPDAPSLRQEPTDAQLREQVAAFLKTAPKALGRPPVTVNRPNFEERRAAAVKKRERVIELVAENLIAFEAATSTLKEIEREMSEIDAAEGEHRASLSQDTAENRKGAKDFIERAAGEWPSLTTGVQRAIIKALAKKITLGKDKVVCVVWKDAGELAVAYAMSALPELRVIPLNALPAPRAKAADLLRLTERRAEVVNA